MDFKVGKKIKLKATGATGVISKMDVEGHPMSSLEVTMDDEQKSIRTYPSAWGALADLDLVAE